MAELSCPVCSADFPVAGDERPGDELYCTYCGTPCRLSAPADAEECRVEEDD